MEQEKSLICQRALLASRETVKGLRVYRCQVTGQVCVLSGADQDEELLTLTCEECKQKKNPS